MFSRLLAAMGLAGPPEDAQHGDAAGSAAGSRRAHALFDAGDYAGARNAYDALVRAGAAPGVLVNRGYCELMLGDADTARASFRAALERAPHLAQAWVGLGDIAAQRNRHLEALQAYDNAIDLDAALLVARNNRAQSLTALGRLEEAWRDGEARFELPNAATLYPHRPALPRWDGRGAPRVLVHWEQGFGDIIQHLRFLPLLGQRTRCVFECPPPLLALVRRMPGAPDVVAATDAAPATAGFDCQAPLLSLPFLLGVKSDGIPPAPYLVADTARADALRQSWRRADASRVIGIAWRASSFDSRRSLDLATMLAALRAQAGDARLVSLQKDISESERALLAQAGGIDAGSGFDGFDDTAAAVAALDQVVCVDTAVAHLAGALDRPVLLLLNEPAAVRWMLGREDSPWYASVRLLRKDAQDGWDGVLQRAAALLPN